MQWLTFEDANDQRFQVRGTPAPQMIEIAADLQRLSNKIPIPGYYLEEGNVPSPSYQWHAWIGHRPIILECEAKLPGNAPGRVFIHTRCS